MFVVEVTIECSCGPPSLAQLYTPVSTAHVCDIIVSKVHEAVRVEMIQGWRYHYHGTNKGSEKDLYSERLMVRAFLPFLQHCMHAATATTGLTPYYPPSLSLCVRARTRELLHLASPRGREARSRSSSASTLSPTCGSSQWPPWTLQCTRPRTPPYSHM